VEGEVMTTQPAELHVTGLLSYVIASADMFYAEMERRDVFLSCNEQGGFRIWGKMTDGEPSTTIDLFEIFLEYALYCCSCADTKETLHNMQDFGERLGRSLAKQFENNFWLSILHNSASQILKIIFETVDAHPSLENVDAGVRIIVADYPLEKAAKRSGLWNVELAHCGINSMCESLVRCINPGLGLSASSDARSEFIFTILTPSYA
jgi:hypothetical protein